MVWSNRVCNPHCRSPLHVVFVLADPPTDTAPSWVCPCLPPFCCLTLFRPLPPTRLFYCGFFFFSWGSVVLSTGWISEGMKVRGRDLMLYLPRSLTLQAWFLIYTLVRSGLTHLGCTATKGSGWGRVKLCSSWSLKWPHQGLDPSAIYCQLRDTSAGNSSGVWR